MHGQVKVSDFGIAKAKNQLHARTRTGEIKGKLAYIPPEQVLGHGIDRRVDIYAMGCVLYVVTLGLRPFGNGAKALGEYRTGYVQKAARTPGRLPRRARTDRDARAVRRSPKRYQTAEEMRFELEQWLLARPSPTQHSDVARVVRERLSDERKKMIEVLFNAGRSIPEALANRYLTQIDRTATPTAASGIVAQPAGLSRSGQQPSATAKQDRATVRPPRTRDATPPAAATAPSQVTTRPPGRSARVDTSPKLETYDTLAQHALAAPPRQTTGEEPTLIAPPQAPNATPRAVHQVAQPVLHESTELLVRRMKPRLLPLVIFVAVAMLVLLSLALTHS